MLAKSGIVICVISLSLGVSSGVNTPGIQALTSQTVEDILDPERNNEHDRMVTLLKDIEELKERNERLEKRIEILEQEKTDKDLIICSIMDQMSKIREQIEDNDKSRNFTLDSPLKLLNEKCKKIKNGSDWHNKDLLRIKRQITPTPTAPIPNIAFTAYLSRTNSHFSPGQAIKFDHVLLNDGAGYNSYTGAFTAPISGTYLFMFQFDSRVHTFVRLNVDGRNIVDAVTNPHVNTQDRENMGGNSAIIHVGVGQSVLVEVYDVSGEVASSEKYRLSTFSGTLLYPEIHN